MTKIEKLEKRIEILQREWVTEYKRRVAAERRAQIAEHRISMLVGLSLGRARRKEV